MSMRKNAVITAAGLIATAAFLVACGPTKHTAAPPPVTNVTPPASTTAAASPTATSTTRPVHDLTPGNCTLYTNADAVSLLGAVNDNNKALAIGTDGGTKIDVCSYLDLKGSTDVQGVSYAVVRYDSDATAFAEAKKVQTELLGDSIPYSVSPTTPVPGAGPLLGGYSTKGKSGLPGAVAVVGTNVGPYLVAALGASTESLANAQNFALTLFQALATAAS